MDNDKSILEKFTDTVKGIASTAADAASAALKAEEPPLKDNDVAAVPLPLAGAGLVSDPVMMVPPIAAPAPRRKKRAAPKRSVARTRKTAKKAGKKTAKKASKKTARKSAKQAAKKTTSKTAKKSAAGKSNKAAKKTTKRAAKTNAKKSRKTVRRRR
jgi:type IV secretory pathway VirB10-like protein